MRISDGSSYVCSSDLVLFGEPLRGALGEITQDHVGAGAAEAQQRFEHRLAFIEPAVVDRALQHRILAADLVRGRDRKRVAEGKSVSVRVDSGGRSLIKKQNNEKKRKNTLNSTK